MRRKSTFSLIAAATLGLAASPVLAGPAAGVRGLGEMADKSLARVDTQVCKWRSGERVCRWYKDEDDAKARYKKRNFDGDVGSRQPEEFETGSTAWWRAMDRQGRGGFGRQ